MKKVGNHKSFSKILLFSLALVLSFSFTSNAQDAAAGKALFNSNCAACHKLDAAMTGPALRGVTERHDTAWLHKWIKNSPELIKSGDAKAIKVFEENGKVAMTVDSATQTLDIKGLLNGQYFIVAENTQGQVVHLTFVKN